METRACYWSSVFCQEQSNGASSCFKSLSWLAARFDGEELSPPYLNPLIPTKFQAPRPVIERQAAWGGNRYFYLEDASAYEELVPSTGGSLKLTNIGTWRELQTVRLSEWSNWKLWHIPTAKKKPQGFLSLYDLRNNPWSALLLCSCCPHSHLISLATG